MAPLHRPFRRAAILGLGLIGGSLALALRQAGQVDMLAGYDRSAATLDAARARGIVDVAYAELAPAVAQADLVVLAVPPRAALALLPRLGPLLSAGTLVTDVCSTKAEIVRVAEAVLPRAVRFVGGHPMAGREQSGIGAADGTLFRGAVWCLTPTATTDAAALAALGALVSALGARPRALDPATHDALVAGVSHLPLVAAAALVRTLARQPDWPEAGTLAAGGFRDTTRVASGDPRMAADICRTNRDALLAQLDAYLATLADLRARIAASDADTVDADGAAAEVGDGGDGDDPLEAVFREAQQARDGWLRGMQATDTTDETGASEASG